MYHGFLNGSRVCIKRVRVYTSYGPQKAAKVHPDAVAFTVPQSLTQLADLLPRGRDVETVDTPKRPPITRSYCHSPPANFGLDVWWRPTRVHQEESRSEPT